MSARVLAAGIAIVVSLLCANTAAAAVLVVGDSLGVGTEGPLRTALAGTEIDSDNLNGRPSSEGVALVGRLLGPEHDTVVFDLGTNDGNAAVAVTAANLAAVRELTADRCLVVATLNRPPLAGIPIDGQNAMIRRFAAATPNVALVDWNDVAQSTPGALGSDGVHATGAGYALRGALFADAIRGGCLGGPGAGTASAEPPTGDREASASARPASRRPRPPSGPPLEDRVAAAVGARLAADGGPLDVARHGAALFAAAAASLREVLTPLGPEPVLGAE